MVSFEDALAVIGNVSLIGLKFAQVVISTAFAFESGGLTAPLTALSFASLVSSTIDFVNDPTGNIARTQLGALKWVGDSIGSPNAGYHLANLVNEVGAPQQGGVPAFIGGIKPLEKVRDLDAKATLGDNVRPSSLMAIADPATKGIRAVRGNAHDRALRKVVELGTDTHALGTAEKLKKDRTVREV